MQQQKQTAETRFRNGYTNYPKQPIAKPLTGEKIVIATPNQSLTIQEILVRYSRGLPVDAKVYQPIPNDEGIFMPEFKKLDLVEKRDYIKRVQNELEMAKNAYNEKLKQQRDAQVQKAVEEKMRQVAASQKQDKTD